MILDGAELGDDQQYARLFDILGKLKIIKVAPRIEVTFFGTGVEIINGQTGKIELAVQGLPLGNHVVQTFASKPFCISTINIIR